jgi:hypothetical protein
MIYMDIFILAVFFEPRNSRGGPLRGVFFRLLAPAANPLPVLTISVSCSRAASQKCSIYINILQGKAGRAHRNAEGREVGRPPTENMRSPTTLYVFVLTLKVIRPGRADEARASLEATWG